MACTHVSAHKYICVTHSGTHDVKKGAVEQLNEEQLNDLIEFVLSL